jgi:alkylated DNA repair dioxygenase AlkB
MSSVVQTSLFDLVGNDQLALGPLGGMVTRQILGRGAWVDLLPGWLSGAGTLFEDLLEQVPWQAERRQMYERVVDVPRLLCFYGEDDPLPHPELVVAGKNEDTMVAIISLGSPRQFLLRPRGGGATIRHQLGHGDLVVMGGSCQRTWEHAVPKTTRSVGPRISVQFRPSGVR